VIALVSVLLVAVAALVYQYALRPSRDIGPTAVAPVDSAFLAVTATPDDATILLNGSPLAYAGFTGRVPAGSLLVATTLPGYRRQERAVYLAADESVSVTFDLQPLTGGLRVTSDPAGATVVVDGNPWSQPTPTDVPGLSVVEPHRIELVLESYHPGVYPAETVIADSLRLLRHDFSVRTAGVAVNSIPGGAEVWLDNEPTGKRTPTSLPAVPYGRRSIRLHRVSYADTTYSLDVNKPDPSVEIELRKLPGGTVWVAIPDGGGEIYVNGEKMSPRTERFPLRLDAGPHEITVRHHSGWEKKKTVTVVSGTEIKETFKKDD
jgi:hypothetical protein